MSGALALSNDSKQDWETPQWVINAAEHIIGGPFDLDACAREDNAKAPNFIAPLGYALSAAKARVIGFDALDTATRWRGDRIWCNPPYADPLPWIQKAQFETWTLKSERRVVMLLPAKTDTRWFHAMVNEQLADQVLLLTPRISFVGSSGSPAFGSLFALFGFMRDTAMKPRIDTLDIRRFKA